MHFRGGGGSRRSAPFVSPLSEKKTCPLRRLYLPVLLIECTVQYMKPLAKKQGMNSGLHEGRHHYLMAWSGLGNYRPLNILYMAAHKCATTF